MVRRNIKTLNSIFSDEAAHSKHVSNYYSEVYSIRENIRKAIQDEKINVNLEDVFTAFDKSIIVREHLHGYTYAQMDKIRYSIMRLFIYYFLKASLNTILRIKIIKHSLVISKSTEQLNHRQ